MKNLRRLGATITVPHYQRPGSWSSRPTTFRRYPRDLLTGRVALGERGWACRRSRRWRGAPT